MAGTPDDPVVYLNGVWGPLSEARIPVLDRGFIFGDGIYEVVPVYATTAGPRMFRARQHLARLTRSLGKVRIDNPFDEAGWFALFARVLGDNPWAGNALIYVQVTRGVARRGHAFPAQTVPTVFSMVSPMTPLSDAARERGVRAVTAADERWLRCDIKSTSLLGNVLAAQHAVEHDAVETIQIRDGMLTEGSSSNVWIVRDGRLIAPPRDHLILEGIRYGLLEELGLESHIPFDERAVTADELRSADEVLLTSASKEVVAVTTLDEQPVGAGRPGPVYAALYAAYQRAKAREFAQ